MPGSVYNGTLLQVDWGGLRLEVPFLALVGGRVAGYLIKPFLRIRDLDHVQEPESGGVHLDQRLPVRPEGLLVVDSIQHVCKSADIVPTKLQQKFTPRY